MPINPLFSHDESDVKRLHANSNCNKMSRRHTFMVSCPSSTIQMSRSLCLKPKPFLEDPKSCRRAPAHQKTGLVTFIIKVHSALTSWWWTSKWKVWWRINSPAKCRLTKASRSWRMCSLTPISRSSGAKSARKETHTRLHLTSTVHFNDLSHDARGRDITGKQRACQ